MRSLTRRSPGNSPITLLMAIHFGIASHLHALSHPSQSWQLAHHTAHGNPFRHRFSSACALSPVAVLATRPSHCSWQSISASLLICMRSLTRRSPGNSPITLLMAIHFGIASHLHALSHPSQPWQLAHHTAHGNPFRHRFSPARALPPVAAHALHPLAPVLRLFWQVSHAPISTDSSDLTILRVQLTTLACIQAAPHTPIELVQARFGAPPWARRHCCLRRQQIGLSQFLCFTNDR